MKKQTTKSWRCATYRDPSQQVRCGDTSSNEVYPLSHRPQGVFNLCLEELPEQYSWIAPLAERYCNEGKLPIYQRANRRFIDRDTFEALVAADPNADDGDPLPRGHFTFWHTYLFLELGADEWEFANRMRYLAWEPARDDPGEDD